MRINAPTSPHRRNPKRLKAATQEVTVTETFTCLVIPPATPSTEITYVPGAVLHGVTMVSVAEV